MIKIFSKFSEKVPIFSRFRKCQARIRTGIWIFSSPQVYCENSIYILVKANDQCHFLNSWACKALLFSHIIKFSNRNKTSNVCCKTSWKMFCSNNLLQQQFIASTIYCINNLLHQQFIASTIYCSNNLLQQQFIAATIYCIKRRCCIVDNFFFLILPFALRRHYLTVNVY